MTDTTDVADATTADATTDDDGAPALVVRARFSAQVWSGDTAVPVDPAGDDEWDATADFAELPADYRAALLAAAAADFAGEAVDSWDILARAPHAPQWVRDWSGPFDLYVIPEPAAGRA